MKTNLLKMSTAILSFSLLVGCNSMDSQEPDPTEEPLEEVEDNLNENAGNDENEPDLDEEPSEQVNEVEEELNQPVGDENEPDLTEEPSEQEAEIEKEMKE